MKQPSPRSTGVELLKLHLRAEGIDFKREHRFHLTRLWRFDFAIEPDLAVEVDGGIWTKGRHTRGAGMEADNVKINTAVLAGWRVLRFSTGQVKSGYAIDTIKRALAR